MLINIIYIDIFSGVCKKCHYLIKELENKDSPKSNVEAMNEQMQDLALVRESLITYNFIYPIYFQINQCSHLK